mgnify:FL=1
MSKIRVAVLFGGVSSEHEISLKSATNVIQNLPKDKYEVVPVGITKKGRWLFYPGDVKNIALGQWDSNPDCTPAVILPDPMYKGIMKIENDSFSFTKIDAVFPVLHGKNGEDGTVQGLLELAQIPYVGCGVLASAVCMDKEFTHIVLNNAGINTAKYRIVRSSDLGSLDEICSDIGSDLGFPVYVKPANGGSSIGVNRAEDPETLKDAVKLAFAHDSKVIVEETITGREIECAVMGNDNPFASTVGEIMPADDKFYDYDAKYVLGSTVLGIPADVPDEVSKEIRETAVKAFGAVNGSGLSRVDFFYADSGKVYINEINTLPGFTAISMYPKLMENIGISYSELLDRLVKLSLEKADVSYE